MPTMGELLLQRQLHQFLGRRRHILEALSEGNNGKSQPFKVLHHLHGAPAVKGDLADVEASAQFLDEFFDEAVMHDVSFRSQEETLLLPKIVLYMVTPYA